MSNKDPILQAVGGAWYKNKGIPPASIVDRVGFRSCLECGSEGTPLGLFEEELIVDL